MIDLPLFAAVERSYHPEPYVIQGQEKPDHLPRLRESAATMERRVLEWFAGRFGVLGYMAQTPTMCAEALGLELTTVRPRITQLLRRTTGPRLERCKWIPRRDTHGGSEGWIRYKFAPGRPCKVTGFAIQGDDFRRFNANRTAVRDYLYDTGIVVLENDWCTHERNVDVIERRGQGGQER